MKLKVLIVDDSSEARGRLRALFEQLGHEVIAEAENGLEGIDFFVSLRPDLVTLDIVMPELDGISALQEIKKLAPSVWTIMVSSLSLEKYRAEAEAVGCETMIVKPATMRTLKTALEKLERKGRVA